MLSSTRCFRRSCSSLPQTCCPIYFPVAGAPDFYSVMSLSRLTSNHPFFTSNAIVRASANSFFHLTPKNTKRGCAVSISAAPSSLSNSNDRIFTHSKLFADACLLADRLHNAVVLGSNDGKLPRGCYSSAPPAPNCGEDGSCNIAIHLAPGYDFCVALLAIWIAKCRAIPLNVHATDSEIEHILTDSQTRIILTSSQQEEPTDRSTTMRCSHHHHHHHFPANSEHQHLTFIPIAFSSTAEGSLTAAHRAAIQRAFQLEAVHPTLPDDDAMLVYTSGTTGKPKGAVHSHRSISTQTVNLLNAWQWSAQDSLLHTLPLHHIHGLVNGVCCGIAASANLDFARAPTTGKSFDPAQVIERLESGDISLFFSVPAAYKKILSYLETRPQEEKDRFRRKMQENVRLFVSGSSALPVPVLKEFEAASGHKMLERYGMTELGMVFSQPYETATGTERIPGTVGLPLPTVEVKLRKVSHDDNGDDDAAAAPAVNDDENFDLLIRSGSMFSRYWGQEDKTAESFVQDDEGKLWFDTGDCVKRIFDESGGGGVGGVLKSYAIQGRTSVDILKVSSYKVSAVEIENALLDTGLLEECAVFALHSSSSSSSSSANDTEDGIVVALVTPSAFCRSSFSAAEQTSVIEKLKLMMEEKFSHYKRPKKYIWAEDGIERNAMGKINKKALAKKYSITC